MMKASRLPVFHILCALVLAAPARLAFAQHVQDPPFGRPDAIVDLATDEGTQTVKGVWRYHDVQIVNRGSRRAGVDLKPSGAPNMTYDLAPHAGAADFDDSHWK